MAAFGSASRTCIRVVPADLEDAARGRPRRPSTSGGRRRGRRSRRRARRARPGTFLPPRSIVAVPSTISTIASPGSPAPHDRLAVLELALDSRVEDRLEELGRQGGEDPRVAGDAPVAAAVEEQRSPFSVAHVLDPAEEERVVAAPVRADDACDEVRERSLDERRVVHELELGLRPVGDAAGETVGEDALPLLEHADAEPDTPPAAARSSCARRSTEMTISGGCRDTDMNAFAVMPWICSSSSVVITVTPVANMPSVRRNSTAASESAPAAASSSSGRATSSQIDSPIPSGALAMANSLGGSISGIVNRARWKLHLPVRAGREEPRARPPARSAESAPAAR